MHIRTADLEDVASIRDLYYDVAAHPGQIALMQDEITDEYVGRFIAKSIESGLILVVVHPDDPRKVIAEMHAYSPGVRAFSHLYTDLTVVVHPDFQGRKIGKTIFMIFLEEIALRRLNIGRVELFVRESNQKAIRFYQSLGFMIQGRLEMRIKTPDGNYEADIAMAWQNPNFIFD